MIILIRVFFITKFELSDFSFQTDGKLDKSDNQKHIVLEVNQGVTVKQFHCVTVKQLQCFKNIFLIFLRELQRTLL